MVEFEITLVDEKEFFNVLLLHEVQETTPTAQRKDDSDICMEQADYSINQCMLTCMYTHENASWAFRISHVQRAESFPFPCTLKGQRVSHSHARSKGREFPIPTLKGQRVSHSHARSKGREFPIPMLKGQRVSHSHACSKGREFPIPMLKGQRVSHSHAQRTESFPIPRSKGREWPTSTTLFPGLRTTSSFLHCKTIVI